MGGHIDELVSRRTALGALLGILLAACGGGSQEHGSAPSATQASSSAPATAPTAGAAATTVAPPTSSAPSTAPAVRGSNAYLTTEVLTSDAHGYNGGWTGAWTEPSSGLSGTLHLTGTVDPQQRTFTVALAGGGAFLPGAPIPPVTVVVNADSFTYNGDNGSFSIRQPSPVGTIALTSVGGMGTGTFKLTVTDVPGHSDVASVECTGVAYRPDQIPIDFTVHFTDGTTSTGHITFTPNR